MNVTGRIATALIAGALLAAPAMTVAQYGGNGYNNGQYNNGYNQQPPPPPGGPGGWDAPPNEYRQQFQQDAFRAGLDGARHDFDNHRRPDVMNRDEFRNYRGPNRRLYKAAFQRGYSAFWSHQGNGFGPGGPRY